MKTPGFLLRYKEPSVMGNVSTDDTQRQRALLLAELAAYRPHDEQERSAQAQIVAFLEREPRCFARETIAGHCTASAFIVDVALSATVLVYHRTFKRWVQPGGHADGEGDLRKVALREAHEETALRSIMPLRQAIYDLHVFDNSSLAPELRHRHFDFRFLMQADRNEQPQVSDESHNVAWIPLDQLGHIDTDESVRNLARKLSTIG